jgi:hypothetical protein
MMEPAENVETTVRALTSPQDSSIKGVKSQKK